MTNKYFIDRNGQTTRRLAGKPGSGHIEVAHSAEKLDPDQDIYQQMFALGYIRVVETDSEIHVDAPKKLTNDQQYAITEFSKTSGKRVVINSRFVIESRTSLKAAKAIIEKMLREGM